jgi:putative intracellular protease/amidase
MEKKKTCYLFVFDGYADWEPALAIAGLNLYSDFAIKTFSFDDGQVTSMGNVQVKPDLSVRELSLTGPDLLLLPGGAAWEEGKNDLLEPVINEAVSQKCSIAAICAGTTILAKAGYLNEINHTSNGLEYLSKYAPQYQGHSFYVNAPAVCDEGIITANGAAMVEFTYEIFKHIGMMSDDELNKWFRIYKSSGMEYSV